MIQKKLPSGTQTSGIRTRHPVPRPVALRLEFNGNRAHLSLDAKLARTAKQVFEVTVSASKFETRYELPRSRAKALRALKRNGFNSHTENADAIKVLPGDPGFMDHVHDWFRGYPRSRRTWKSLAELPKGEYRKRRVQVYEYYCHKGLKAVTLELDNGKQVRVENPANDFDWKSFLKRTGQ
ncbi:MAG: hypothetical protein WCO56_07330 [Verrucomicrobiota bacterium]